MWIALVFVPAFFVAAVFLHSALSGWGALARVYPSESFASGTEFTFRSAGLGRMNYHYCLRLVANPDGLLLDVHPLFRPGHRPFFVPWQEISSGAQQNWGFPVVDFRFARHPEIRFRVSQNLAEQLLAAGGLGERERWESRVER